MWSEFKRALARVQSDYGFFIGCQTDPAGALGSYDLRAREQSALSNPSKLAEVFERGLEASRIVIKISGTHDWVNRVGPVRASADGNRDEMIALQVDAIRHAGGAEQRTEATFKLMELIG